MTPQMPGRFPFRWFLACAGSLVFVAGCECDFKADPTLYAVLNGGDTVSYDHQAIASQRPDAATTVTDFELRQQYQHDQEVRYTRQQARADEVRRHRDRLYQQSEQLRRRWDEYVEEDRRRKELRQEQRQRQDEQRQRLNRQLAQRSSAETWQTQQLSQTFDGLMQQIQQRQEEQQREKAIRSLNRGIISRGGSNP